MYECPEIDFIHKVKSVAKKNFLGGKKMLGTSKVHQKVFIQK